MRKRLFPYLDIFRFAFFERLRRGIAWAEYDGHECSTRKCNVVSFPGDRRIYVCLQTGVVVHVCNASKNTCPIGGRMYGEQACLISGRCVDTSLDGDQTALVFERAEYVAPYRKALKINPYTSHLKEAKQEIKRLKLAEGESDVVSAPPYEPGCGGGDEDAPSVHALARPVRYGTTEAEQNAMQFKDDCRKLWKQLMFSAERAVVDAARKEIIMNNLRGDVEAVVQKMNSVCGGRGTTRKMGSPVGSTSTVLPSEIPTWSFLFTMCARYTDPYYCYVLGPLNRDKRLKGEKLYDTLSQECFQLHHQIQMHHQEVTRKKARITFMWFFLSYLYIRDAILPRLITVTSVKNEVLELRSVLPNTKDLNLLLASLQYKPSHLQNHSSLVNDMLDAMPT